MSTTLKVMIVRHGEKPEVKQQAPFGVTKDGEQDWDSLTVRGWQRAGGLACLFASPRHPALAQPKLIYASKRRTDAPAVINGNTGSRSKRPRQTIAPLANRLSILPNLEFGKGDEAGLVADVLRQDVPVLIAWQHEAICAIAQGIVGTHPPQQAIPTKWPGTRFDIVWVLDSPAENGGPWRFTQVPQQLLKGDSDSVIA